MNHFDFNHVQNLMVTADNVRILTLFLNMFNVLKLAFQHGTVN